MEGPGRLGEPGGGLEGLGALGGHGAALGAQCPPGAPGGLGALRAGTARPLPGAVPGPAVAAERGHGEDRRPAAARGAQAGQGEGEGGGGRWGGGRRAAAPGRREWGGVEGRRGPRGAGGEVLQLDRHRLKCPASPTASGAGEHPKFREVGRG